MSYSSAKKKVKIKIRPVKINDKGFPFIYSHPPVEPNRIIADKKRDPFIINKSPVISNVSRFEIG
jgi:hypothetical protein